MIWVYVAFLVLCGILAVIEYFTGIEMPEREDGKEMQ